MTNYKGGFRNPFEVDRVIAELEAIGH